MNKTLIAALSLSILLVAPACHKKPKKTTTKSTQKSIDLLEAMIEEEETNKNIEYDIDIEDEAASENPEPVRIKF